MPPLKRRAKPAIAIDFDGTIADYSQGYQGPGVYGELLPGAREAILRLAETYHIIVFTARGTDEHERIMEYLQGLELPIEEVTNVKPPAAFYIDDRALRFTAWDDMLKQVAHLTELDGTPDDATLDVSEE